MTLIPPTRKRNRSCGEEDFLPLSKKINNLHINNWGNIENQQDQLFAWNNRTEQWLTAQNLLLLNGERSSKEESPDSSLYESVQESRFQNPFTSTNSNNCFERYSFESSPSQFNCENKNQENGQNNWSMTYNPDLNIDENPYYYENNKLLFELYIERLQRGGC